MFSFIIERIYVISKNYNRNIIKKIKITYLIILEIYEASTKYFGFYLQALQNI